MGPRHSIWVHCGLFDLKKTIRWVRTWEGGEVLSFLRSWGVGRLTPSWLPCHTTHLP
jgi:hypothetical protein